MQELFNRYINHLVAEKNASPYTVRNYQDDMYGSRVLKGFFPFMEWKKVGLEHVDKLLIRDYLAYLGEQGVVRASIARKLSVIRSFFNYLVREGVVSRNPAKDISSPKLEKHLPSFLTQAEIQGLLDSIDTGTPSGLRDRALFEVLYASGLRVSELVKLNMDDVDLESHEIRVRAGKGNKDRIVLIGEPAVRAVSDYVRNGRQLLAASTAARQQTPVNPTALFINYANGKRLSARSVQLLLNHHAVKNGIDKWVHPHMLRHTFATHLLDGGADLRVVQELLGHTSLASTQIYTHVSKTQAKKVYLSAHPMARDENNEAEDA